MSKRKTITIKVAVPKWARWVAADRDGALNVFDAKPVAPRVRDYWVPQYGGDYERIGELQDMQPDWRKTLRRLK